MSRLGDRSLRERDDKFTTRTRDWNEVEGIACLPQIPRVMIRLEHNIIPKCNEKVVHVDEWKNDNLTAKINNVFLLLNSNSLTSLTDFFVDEKPSKSLPFEATIENINIKLCSQVPNDALQDESSIKPIDTEINLNKLKIKRTNNGAVCVEPMEEDYDSPNSSNQLIEIMEELKKCSIENEYLHRKLGTLERLKEENFELRKFQEENRRLKLLLNEAQDNISKLLGEKQNLLDQVHVLKESKTNMIMTSKR